MKVFEMFSARTYGWIAAVVVVLLLGWLVHPWWHGITMWLYLNPIGFALGGLMIAFMALTALSKDNYGVLGEWTNRFVVLTAIFLVLFFWYIVCADSFMYVTLAQETDYQIALQLPSNDKLRLLPLSVASEFGVGSSRDPLLRAYVWQPQIWKGRLAFVAARIPSGSLQHFIGQSNGVMVIDAGSKNSSMKLDDQKMKLSEGVGFARNIRWQIYQKEYFIDTPEVIYGVDSDQIVAIVPVIAYHGFPIRTPYFDGAWLVWPDGKMKRLSSKEAPENPIIIASGRLFPEVLARYIHDAYAYRQGLWNTWFVHRDQTEIKDPDESNEQPYYRSTVEGPKWTTAAEPYGRSFGLYKIFETDALSGVTKIVEPSKRLNLSGPSESLSSVRGKFPDYNWEVKSKESVSGSMIVLEPRPILSGDQLFWMVSIAASDYKSIERTCFVNARTRAVTSAISDEEARAFVLKNNLSTSSAMNVATATPSSTPKKNSQEIEEIRMLLKDALERLDRLEQNN